MDTQLFNELRSTWHEMKARLDETNADTAESKQAIARLNARLDQIETANKRPPLSGMDVKVRPSPLPYDLVNEPNREGRLFFKMVALGGLEKLRDPKERAEVESNLTATEQKFAPTEGKALSLGDDTMGGFLAPSEFVSEIIKGVTLVSPMRSLARVRPTVRRSVQVPARAGVFSASWIGEQAVRSESLGLAYTMEELPTYELYALVLASRDDLEDSAFDLEAEIAAEAAEQFAKAEGAAFINGDSIKKPEGVMVNQAVASDNSGNASALTGDGIIAHLYNLKSSYVANARFIMNRKTLGAIRQLKDSYNRYLWEPNFQAGTPPNILGVPYVEMPDMDDIAAGKYPVAVGDFSRGYYIVDRVDVNVQRLNELFAQNNQVGFLVRKRVGGQVVLPEAIRKLKVSA